LNLADDRAFRGILNIENRSKGRTSHFDSGESSDRAGAPVEAW
jgi:hypothetical protein